MAKRCVLSYKNEQDNHLPLSPMKRHRLTTLAFIMLSMASQTTFAASTKPTLLNPQVTQAIGIIGQSNAQNDSGVMSGREVLTASNAATNQPPVVITKDDGGEVDIADSQIPIPPSAPAFNATAPTTSPVNTMVIPSRPTDPAIMQIPLGAVSPDTIGKFVKLVDIVRQEYVKPIDDEALFKNAMSGMLLGLDPYSEYLDSEAYNNLKLFTDGDVGSIGVKVSYHADSKAWVFDEVLPNSPAARTGIQRGNFLHQINDNKLNDEQTQMDIDQLLSGIAGTQVKLVVSDSGRRKHTTTVQRSLVQQQAIEANVVKGIAVVQIPIFQNTTQQQVLSALSNLSQPFTAILLDVRNNPGGVLSSANDVASLFMANKSVVQVKNRQGLQEVMRTQPKAQFANIPLAVLQNRYSASAAEVLASSLQENGRAKIYGETSYGKGSIQSIVPIDDDEAVKLTVAHYYSGKGKKIDGVGVTPDVGLSDSELNWQNEVVTAMLLMPRPYQYQLQPDRSIQAF